MTNALLFETVQYSPSVARERPPLVEQVRAAAAAGFDGIAFDRPSLAELIDDLGQLHDLGALCDEVGLRVRTVSGVRIGDADVTRQSVEGLVPVLRALRPRSAQAIFAVPADAARLQLTEAAARLADEGVLVAAEFIPMSPVPDLASARRALDGIANVGVCVDSWHVERSSTTWAEIEALDPAEIANVQFDDALPLESDDLMSETLHRRALPGDGELDLDRFAQVLRRIGYTGPVGLEILSDELRSLPLAEFAARVHASGARYWRPELGEGGGRQVHPAG